MPLLQIARRNAPAGKNAVDIITGLIVISGTEGDYQRRPDRPLDNFENDSRGSFAILQLARGISPSVMDRAENVRF